MRCGLRLPGVRWHVLNLSAHSARQGVVGILRWLSDEEVVDVQYLQVSFKGLGR